MSRTQQIQSILSSRKPNAEKAANTLTKLSRLEDAFRGVQGQINEISSSVPDVSGKLDPYNNQIETFLKNISEQKKRFDQLQARFSRRSLNIGVIGLARQGKSTLLQQITGLDEGEIPTGDKGYCTGAPSLIHNALGQETYGIVEFYSQSSFIEDVLKPYFSVLDLSSPNSLSAFASTKLPKEIAASDDSLLKQNYLEKLRQLQQNLSAYQDLLGTGTLRITREQIRTYVAQEDKNREKIYQWMAVKLVNIYCSFPHEDVGLIAVGDTPGLGDFIPGEEDRLVQTVGENLDVLLFLKMPPSTGAIATPNDVKLYDRGKAAIPELSESIDRWSYYIINKTSNNVGQLDFFADQLKSRGIKTRGQYKVNCRDKDEVAATLSAILDDVSGNLSSLDSTLFYAREAGLKAFYDEVQQFVDKLKKVKFEGAVDDEDEAYEDLFDALWGDLSAAIAGLLSEYHNERDEGDVTFEATLKRIQETLRQGFPFPDEETCRREIAAYGGATKNGAQEWFTKKQAAARVRFAQSFLPFDDCFKDGYNQLRSKLLEVFLEQGRFKNLSEIQKADSVVGKLEVIRDIFLDHSKNGKLADAIDQLLKAKLSYDNLTQPRIYKYTEIFNSSEEGKNPNKEEENHKKIYKAYQYDGESEPTAMQEKINEAWLRVTDNCYYDLDGMKKEPSMAKFATIDNFHNRWIGEDGNEKAKQNLRLMYRKIKAQIWPEQYEKLAQTEAIRRNWEQAVANLQQTLTQN